METLYHALALLVLLVHCAFALWVYCGGFVARRSRLLFRIHMASVAWGLLAVTTGYACPLTRLENHFRLLAGLPTYEAECIPHYVWEPLNLPGGAWAGVLMVTAALLLNYLAYRPRAPKLA